MIPRHLTIGVIVLLVVAVVMGLYVWHVSSIVPHDAPVADTRPVAAPVSGPTEHVTLCVAYDDSGVLVAQSANILLPQGRQQRAEELLRALLDIYLDKSSPHSLGAGSDVRSVYLVDPGLAVIDLNSAFADGHRSGVLVEELTIASLVETLALNLPDVRRVKVLVDGKERETLAGHVDLSNFYDVTAVNQMVTQLQPAQ